MILIDSSVWIAYFNGVEIPETTKLDNLLGNAPLTTGDLILTEVLQGFRREKDCKIAKELLTTFPVKNLLNTSVAIQSADNFRLLRKRGITVRKTIDVIIATFCIENKYSLLHCDKDFLPFHKQLCLLNAMTDI